MWDEALVVKKVDWKAATMGYWRDCSKDLQKDKNLDGLRVDLKES